MANRRSHSPVPILLESFAKKFCRISTNYLQPQHSRISAPSPTHFEVFVRFAHVLSIRGIDRVDSHSVLTRFNSARDLKIDSPSFNLLEYLRPATINFLLRFHFGEKFA
jgi:hypothetical protein